MDDFPQAALSLVQDDDPVVRKIAEKALQAIAEHKFRRGRATPKGDRIRRLAPVLELMRANNATFEQMLDLCRSEGLDVTAETVRTVLGWRRKDQNDKSGSTPKPNDKSGCGQTGGSVSDLSARIRTKQSNRSNDDLPGNSGAQKAADASDAKQTSTTGVKRQSTTQAKNTVGTGTIRDSGHDGERESTPKLVVKSAVDSDGDQVTKVTGDQTGSDHDSTTHPTESAASARVAPADKKKFGLDRITAR